MKRCFKCIYILNLVVLVVFSVKTIQKMGWLPAVLWLLIIFGVSCNLFGLRSLSKWR